MKIKNLKFTIVLLIITSFMSVAFSQNTDRIFVRIYEGRYTEIYVIRKDEVIEFKELKTSDNHRNNEENSLKISGLINKYLELDYNIINTVSGGNDMSTITTLILEKKE